MNAIQWPAGYEPGHTDNFVSNEMILPGLELSAVWSLLTDTREWPAYYGNVSDIQFKDGSGPKLSKGSRFRFTTFSFPVEAEVTEHVEPEAGMPGRIAWHGWVEGDEQSRLDVHHAWLFEELPGGRIRLLTQETQNGAPARSMANTRPNPMLNAHQAWLDGIANTARARTKA